MNSKQNKKVKTKIPNTKIRNTKYQKTKRPIYQNIKIQYQIPKYENIKYKNTYAKKNKYQNSQIPRPIFTKSEKSFYLLHLSAQLLDIAISNPGQTLSLQGCYIFSGPIKVGGSPRAMHPPKTPPQITQGPWSFFACYA